MTKIISAPSLVLTRLSLSSRRMIFIFGGKRLERGSFHHPAVGYAHRTEPARHVSLLPLLQIILLQLARSVRGVSSACCSPWPSPVVPRHCYPLTAVLSPPPPKYSGNEEGAKMTGSIFDFASRTCASTTVPRELALGAGSSGMIRVSTATSSSAATAMAEVSAVSARSPAREGAKMTSSKFAAASARLPCPRAAACLPFLGDKPSDLPPALNHDRRVNKLRTQICQGVCAPLVSRLGGLISPSIRAWTGS